MVEIVEWLSRKNLPGNEGNPDRKEAANTVLKLCSGRSLSSFFEAGKHVPWPLVPRHQDDGHQGVGFLST